MISFILRHQPWLYELELDDEGWVPVSELMRALHTERRWLAVKVSDLERVVQLSSKQRFEIGGGRIRALYGHSLPGKLKKTPAEPPPTLYHGTTDAVVERIMDEGLRPMSRQFVHLSVDTQMARQVARRKDGMVVVLSIAAKQAHHDGIRFYEGNDAVWLADEIPANYLVKD